MQKYFFTTIIVVLIMVTFAILNARVVEINFGFKSINISLALTIFIVFAIGALVSYILSISGIYKLKKENKNLKKKNSELASEINTLNSTATDKENSTESSTDDVLDERG
ncbi:MAG: LapA family protein [Bacteroidota bacterium]|nr:LapA family protein [Bacteroidota bacterium]